MDVPMKGVDAVANSFGEGRYRYYALFLLFLVNVFNAADRGIMPILAEQVKADLRITDAQLAFLHGTAFITLFTLLGIPASRLADRMSRPRLLAGGLVAWSGCTAMGALASRFETLTLARVGVGIGEAAANPTTHSMLCDYFPVRLRSRVMAIYLCGIFVGGGLAAAIGGHLISVWPVQCVRFALCEMRPWQLSFLLLGVPGILLALLVVRLRDPIRGASENAPSMPPSSGHWRAAFLDLLNVTPIVATVLLMREGASGAVRRNLLGALILAVIVVALVMLTGDVIQWVALAIGIYAIMSWSQRMVRSDPALSELTVNTPSFFNAVAGYSLLGAMIGAVQFWMFPYAIRNLGASAGHVGFVLGPITSVGAIIGALAGSAVADIMRTRSARGYLLWSIVVLLLISLSLIAMLMSKTMTNYTISALLFSLSAYGWSAAAGAQAQDLVLPRMRAMTSVFNALSITIATVALGPYTVGRLADSFGSLLVGLTAVLALAPIGCILLWRASKTVTADQATKWERAEQRDRESCNRANLAD